MMKIDKLFNPDKLNHKKKQDPGKLHSFFPNHLHKAYFFDIQFFYGRNWLI